MGRILNTTTFKLTRCNCRYAIVVIRSISASMNNSSGSLHVSLRTSVDSVSVSQKSSSHQTSSPPHSELQSRVARACTKVNFSQFHKEIKLNDREPVPASGAVVRYRTRRSSDQSEIKSVCASRFWRESTHLFNLRKNLNLMTGE